MSALSFVCSISEEILDSFRLLKQQRDSLFLPKPAVWMEVGMRWEKEREREALSSRELIRENSHFKTPCGYQESCGSGEELSLAWPSGCL